MLTTERENNLRLTPNARQRIAKRVADYLLEHIDELDPDRLKLHGPAEELEARYLIKRAASWLDSDTPAGVKLAYVLGAQAKKLRGVEVHDDAAVLAPLEVDLVPGAYVQGWIWVRRDELL